jgi:hypothetical protein
MGEITRAFIMPAKANTEWELVGGTPDDALIEMRVSPQTRKKCPELQEKWRVRAITIIDQSARKHVLLTSLFETKQHKAKDIAACHTQRWQIETSYRELNQSMMGMTLPCVAVPSKASIKKSGEP